MKASASMLTGCGKERPLKASYLLQAHSLRFVCRLKFKCFVSPCAQDNDESKWSRHYPQQPTRFRYIAAIRVLEPIPSFRDNRLGPFRPLVFPIVVTNSSKCR